MPNLIELLDRSIIIRTKVSSIIEEIQYDIDNGNITNEVEAFTRLQNDVTSFINRLIDITLEVKEASVAPVSSDINEMFNSIYNDIKYIYEFLKNTENIIDIANNRAELERNMLISIQNNINSRLEELENNLFFDKEYMESFVNNDLYDIEMTDTPANINKQGNYLTLDVINKTLYNDSYIEILDTSNGYPGNTHEGTIENNKIKYIGELDPHINLNNINDNNTSTWFEYEIYDIDKKDFDKTLGYGFKYKEGNKWITTDNYLELKLSIEFRSQKYMNEIILNPYLPVYKSYIPSIIKEIVIDDGMGDENIIGENIVFNNEVCISFNKQNIKRITITLLQEKSYETLVAHEYFIKTKLNHNYLEKININGTRIEGALKTSTALGFKFDAVKHAVIQPNTLEYIEDTNSIFNLPEIKDDIYQDIELLNGNRYQIGIRNIDTMLTEYEMQSSYISKTFDMTGLNTFSIYANDQFNEEDVLWYYYSFDNGKEWKYILPFRKDEEGETHIVSGDKMRVKIILATDNKYRTPIIYDYKIQGKE